MPAIYILRSVSTGKFYVGATGSLPERIGEHQRGQTPSTRGRGPWVLAHQEPFDTMKDALKRERQIKSWKSHRLIQQLIESGS